MKVNRLTYINILKYNNFYKGESNFYEYHRRGHIYYRNIFGSISISDNYVIRISNVDNLKDAQDKILKINPNCFDYIDNVKIVRLIRFYDIPKALNIDKVEKIFGGRKSLYDVTLYIQDTRITISRKGRIILEYGGSENLQQMYNKMDNLYNFVVCNLFSSKFSLDNIKLLTKTKTDVIKCVLICCKDIKIRKFIPKLLLLNVLLPIVVKYLCLDI